MLKLKNLDLGVREKLDVLVTDVTEAETKTKKPYVIFTATDGEQTVKVKKWDCCLSDYERAKNHVITMNIKAGTYGGETTYDTDMAVYSDADVKQFIPSVPGNIEEMIRTMKNRADAFSNNALKECVQFFLKTEKERLNHWAAAKRNHHALYGGLVYHMYRMGKAADALCDVYQDLDRDLLVAGAYLHDIGKLQELDTNELGIAEYTTEGNLFGHLYLGMQMLDEYTKDHDLPTDIGWQLKHMIASHHGTREWGAVVEPKTAEAQMLHYLDMIDSRMYVFEEMYNNMESDSFEKSPIGQIYKF